MAQFILESKEVNKCSYDWNAALASSILGWLSAVRNINGWYLPTTYVLWVDLLSVLIQSAHLSDGDPEVHLNLNRNHSLSSDIIRHVSRQNFSHLVVARTWITGSQPSKPLCILSCPKLPSPTLAVDSKAASIGLPMQLCCCCWWLKLWQDQTHEITI